ncbi:hypothetical protein [Flavobacterium beibuense]|uniref:hypothetical protein n=1 Tax=Flavobacterium beibuense TaxID=657326 RepID=UPI003A908BAE
MKKNLFYIVALLFFIVGCSDDKDNINMNEDVNQKIVLEEGREKGSIPSVMEIKKIFSGITKPQSFSEYVKLYKKDVARSVDTDFDTNLKNMWMIIINKKLSEGEGTEDQKKFFVYEQLNFEHNLPHFGSFYKLLTNLESIDQAEKDRISKEYRIKNQKAIDQIRWHNPEEKKEKEQQLLMARRTYGILQIGKK